MVFLDRLLCASSMIVLLSTLSSTMGLFACSSDWIRHKPARMNVLLIILDTVRADRLSCYGYGAETTPAIDALARKGLRFERFFSNASWTLPSHASIFTGLYPAAHRATQETLRLSDARPTLAEIFSKAGYQTFGASSNPIVRRRSGLARGFQVFHEVFRGEGAEPSTERDRRMHRNNAAFEEFLATSDRKRPFFAFLNYIEAHLPYDPPPAFASKFVGDDFLGMDVSRARGLLMPDHYVRNMITEEDFRILSHLYDAEIAYVDAQIGQLISFLEADGRLDDTIVVITSDHGDNIGEHGHFAHVLSIYNTLLHVPLVIVLPDGAHAGEVRRDIGQSIDLFPTLLAYCGLEYDGEMHGRNLFAEGAETVRARAMAEYYYPRQVMNVLGATAIEQRMEEFLPYMRRLRALQDGGMKLIWGSDGRHELYDIAKDPYEQRNLLLDHPDDVRLHEMVDALLEIVDESQGTPALGEPPPPFWKIEGMEGFAEDEAVLEKLRALGYVR